MKLENQTCRDVVPVRSLDCEFKALEMSKDARLIAAIHQVAKCSQKGHKSSLRATLDVHVNAIFVVRSRNP
jgi:hypothetical protein